MHTDRPAPRLLPLPKQDDCFFFAIYGDRTGGQPEGLQILRQAVADTNLLDPDLVMTVGDLVQGYNRPERWLRQMREYKGVMERLRMPWFPVAGNHDTYGPLEKEGIRFAGNAAHYEKHFGPLWYWFEHKKSGFLVLYTDEGDPRTGEVAFRKPELQKMSPAQLAWLQRALAATAKLDHVFVFLHHPRWHKGNYGDDWEKVHKTLAAAGNVRAVFAGHIHHIVHSGKRDGIEYLTLGATGSSLSAKYPKSAGYLHHFNLVTVRPEGIRVSTIPVGTVLDPSKMTEALIADVRKLEDRANPRPTKKVAIGPDGRVDGDHVVRMKNPSRRSVEYTLVPESSDPRWQFQPDHRHVVVPAGQSRTVGFRVHHPGRALDGWFAVPEIRVQADYLAKGLRIALRERRVPFELTPPATPPRPVGKGGYFALGEDGYLLAAREGDGVGRKFTVEAFVACHIPRGRQVLVADPRFVLSLDAGRPSLSVATERGTFRASASYALEGSIWNHVVGVFDGAEIRVYLNGRQLAARGVVGAPDHATKLQRDRAELLIGARRNKSGSAVDFGNLNIDEVRISRAVRYAYSTYPRTDRVTGFKRDAATALLLHCDRAFGPWAFDDSKYQQQPERRGATSWMTNWPRR